MNNQNFEDAELPASGERTQSSKIRDAAGEAFSKASDTARDAGEKAKRAAADAASSMSDHVMGLLNDQLGVGAQSANRFAGSMRVAADDLEHENPMLAGLVRGFAHNVDHYADRAGGSNGRTAGQKRLGPHATAAGFDVWPGSAGWVFCVPYVQKCQRTFCSVTSDPANALPPSGRQPWLSNIHRCQTPFLRSSPI